MEYEIRFYFNSNKKDKLIKNLKKLNLTETKRTFELTSQFDHPDKKFSFYNKKIDGRFRVRLSKNDLMSKCKISWKKRLKNTNGPVNKEEEIEVGILAEEYKNLLFLLNSVLNMKLVESYERYRTSFFNETIEISLDEYPFGIALEIENKGDEKFADKNILDYVKKLDLNLSDRYKLSWDDKYGQLCKEQGIKRYNIVTFDKPMPTVK